MLFRSFFVKHESHTTDAEGNVTEIRCTYDPETRGGNAPDGRKVKTTLHWVSAAHAVDVQVALYDRLFTAKVPGDATGEELAIQVPDGEAVGGGVELRRHRRRLRMRRWRRSSRSW